MPSVASFFLGFLVDEDLGRRLAECDEYEKAYLEDPEYLERLFVDGVEYIGRTLDGIGLPVNSVEDSARNVASLIKRVVPDWEGRPGGAALLAIEQDIVNKDVVLGL